MKTADFDYKLPKEFIAQDAVEPRDSARLLVLDRKTEFIHHKYFRDILNDLIPGDVLVLNHTKVIPARLFGRKISTGGKVECLLLNEIDPWTWKVLIGGKGVSVGSRIQIDQGPQAEITHVVDHSQRIIHFDVPVQSFLSKAGQVPLPPYIQMELKNPERYQTIYAQVPGSAAAPTAGLHFTPELIQRIREAGIQIENVTLHIGLDTFAPVHEENPHQHIIHTEWCHIPEQTARAVNLAKEKGNRVIAVGTTCVRTLETSAKYAQGGEWSGIYQGPTDLFILPGYNFKVVNAMVTNFHLPRSSLIMLVSAFAGRDQVLGAYEIAKQHHYRFYSFGDAMLII